MSKDQSSYQLKSNIIWIILAIINLLLVLLFINKYVIKGTNQLDSTNSSNISLSKPEQTLSPIVQDSPVPDFSTLTIPNQDILFEKQDYFFILSIFNNQASHLYVYNPQSGLFTRLSDSPYEEIHPAISPDAKNLAYSAKKNGYWDIYIINLTNGMETRVTDTYEYEGSPSWSSDGLFLAYESYKYGNLDIFIQDINNLQSPAIQLTDNPYSQFSPSWSPNGREIAFVSTEDGDEEIWVAKLDNVENRFQKIINRPNQVDLNPHWSSDGNQLLWTSENYGYPIIMQIDYSETNLLLSEMGIGDNAQLSENSISYIQSEANQNFLIHKDLLGEFLIPPVKIPGNVHGFSILSMQTSDENLINQLMNHEILLSDNHTDTTVFPSSNQKVELVMLDGVETDYPYLSNAVVDQFNRLRTSVGDTSGWDFLSQLEKTFIPITEPTTPGISEEWLYTGRAFQFNPLSIYAGLTTTVKEERNGQTYWRIYLKARYQDGSQGIPLRVMPFDLSARYNNDPKTYENGGEKTPIPPGYWIDLTELALDSSWERVPAISNWQRYFDSARFNQFIYSNGLDWYAAMKEIYPLEAFMSPTPIPTNPLTPTSSPTVRFFRSPTISSTPTLTIVATRRPTWTPNP